jgi:hypothetical protein
MLNLLIEAYSELFKKESDQMLRLTDQYYHGPHHDNDSLLSNSKKTSEEEIKTTKITPSRSSDKKRDIKYDSK